jgi:hypothetical protein
VTVDLSPVLSLLSLLPVQYASPVIAGAALVSMALPPPTPTTNPVYSTVYRLVNVLGANAFHARNATAPAPAPKQPK